MPRAEMVLPVFLPGKDRDWVQVQGRATIDADGDVLVKLNDPKDADMLVEMAQERILLQVSFDYRQSDAVLERIHERRGTNARN